MGQIALELQEQRLIMNGPGGLVVKVLAQSARYVGLIPTWFQLSQQFSNVKRINLLL